MQAACEFIETFFSRNVDEIYNVYFKSLKLFTKLNLLRMAYKTQHFLLACVAKFSMFDQLDGNMMDIFDV